MSYQLTCNDPKQLKRDVRSAVLGVSAFLVTMSIVSTVVIVVAGMIENWDLVLAYSADPSASLSELTDRVIESAWDYSGLGSIIGMLCGIPWLLLVRGTKLFTSDAVKVHSKVNGGTIAVLFMCILAVQFFMVLIQLGIEPFFNQNDTSLTDVLDESTVSLASSFWGALYIVIIGPICEELVFRGAIMRKLERYGANFAIIVSSLLFGLYHIILFQSLFAFLIGLILGYTAGRFSLKWAVLLHMLNNGLAVLSTVIPGEGFVIALSLLYFASFVGTTIVLIWKRKFLLAQKRAGAPSEVNVYGRAFSSPWLIIYIVLTVLGGISLLGIF